MNRMSSVDRGVVLLKIAGWLMGAWTVSLPAPVVSAPGEKEPTLAEWTRIVTADDLHWRSDGRGGREAYVEHLEALALKPEPGGEAEARTAAFKLGTYYLKLEDSRHDHRLLAWRWFREAGGDDHALTQLALGYVLLSLAKEINRSGGRRHVEEVGDALERIGEPALAALEKAVSQEDDPVLRRRAGSILHDVRKRIEERKK